MSKYVLFWLTGEPEVIEGSSISSAFMLSGYGGGAIAALDYYATVKPEDEDLSLEELVEKYKVKNG